MSKARNYCFTINNWTEDDKQGLREIKGVKYVVFGDEVGSSGTPHLQGTICFRSPRHFPAVSKLLPRAHVEVCRDVGGSIRYCKKDGKYEEMGVEPEKNGGDKLTERIAKNKRLLENTLKESLENGDVGLLQVPLLKKAKYIIAQEGDAVATEDVRGVWYFGPPGAGKSHRARTEYPDAYIKAQNKWWDGYTGQSAVILDDLDTDVLGHYLKIWADKWPCSGEVKGGTVPLKHQVFVVTSNYDVDELFKEEHMRNAVFRRFKIHHMNKKFC